MGLQRKYTNILTKEFLEQEYTINKKSSYLIGKETNTNNKTVMEYIRMYNIPVQKPLYNNRKKENHPNWVGIGEISGSIFNNIKNNAKNRNISFNITLDFIWNLYLKQNKKCALTGMDINFIDTKKYNASLDRKDPKQGYTENNVWWIHSDVNYAKQSLSVDDFLNLCKKVTEYNR